MAQKAISYWHDSVVYGICKNIQETKTLYVQDGFFIKKIPVKSASINPAKLNFAGNYQADIIVETESEEQVYLEIVNTNKLNKHKEKLKRYKECKAKVFVLTVTDIISEFDSSEMIKIAIERSVYNGFKPL